MEALPNTEVVSASEAALIAAPPVRASICPQGHPNPPELRECLICAQPLTGVFSYVRRPALATLTLSTGAAVEVAGDVVIGRAPRCRSGRTLTSWPWSRSPVLTTWSRAPTSC